jgi:hypothetical protein
MFFLQLKSAISLAKLCRSAVFRSTTRPLQTQTSLFFSCLRSGGFASCELGLWNTHFLGTYKHAVFNGITSSAICYLPVLKMTLIMHDAISNVVENEGTAGNYYCLLDI